MSVTDFDIFSPQNDGARINAFNCKDFPTFYVFEHVACFDHGISSLGSNEGFKLLTYLLLPSAPPDEPPILPKSMKGTAPPET